MKKNSARKIAVKSVKNVRKTNKDWRRGALGAGMAYTILALLVIAAAGTAMIGSIAPIVNTSEDGQHVVLITKSPDGQKDTLQLETFQGVTITPTPSPTIPPPTSAPVPNGGGGKGGGGSCFPAGTRILMADNTQKNIEAVTIGDQVLGWDGVKQQTETVLATENPVRDHLYSLTFSDGSTLKLTREHPLFTKEGWKSISPASTAEENPNLKVTVLNSGDSVLNSQGDYITVSSLEFIPGNVQTYNLKSVDGFNDYYANGKLAHNKGSTPSRGNGGGGGGGGSSGL